MTVRLLFQDLVADLEGVERSLEPETVDSTLPPGSRDGEADSPETLSVCSDVHCDEPCGVTADSGVEDDDSLSVTHGEDGTDRTAAHKKPRKKISLDVSLEKMFLAAAAKAKQFAQEKQIGRGKLSPTDKSASAERADGHLLSPELSDSSTSTRRLSDQGSEVEEVGSDGPGSGIWREDSEGVPLVKETASSHSDEGESRLSGSDITALEDERCGPERGVCRVFPLYCTCKPNPVHQLSRAVISLVALVYGRVYRCSFTSGRGGDLFSPPCVVSRGQRAY